MSEEAETRNEVYIDIQKIDTATQIIIEKKTISLKSMKDSIDDLIEKAKKI